MGFLLAAASLLLGTPQTGHARGVAEHLARVRVFAFGPTGYAGRQSSGERDFRTLLVDSSALADFERVYSSGTLEAKCYALVGIRKLSPARFAELVKPLRGSGDAVTTLHGCILSEESLGKIVKQIEAGKYGQ